MDDALLPSVSLVQREAELESLRHALLAPSSVVLLEGEAGIGKTRFLSEALKASDARVLIGHCVRQRQPAPLLAIVEALRGTDRMMDRSRLSPICAPVAILVPELAHVLPDGPARPADPATAQHQLFRGVIEILRALSPVVLVLEDLHWADDSTIELLQLLVHQKLPNLHLLLTVRRQDLPRGSALLTLPSQVPAGVLQLRLELGPLDERGVKSMIEVMLSTQVTDDFATFIYERTGGVPFAVEETLRLLSARRDLVRLHGSWARHAVDTLKVPVAIQDAVLERIGRLDSRSQEVVAALAVLGEDATISRLALLTGLDDNELDSALDACVDSVLVRERGHRLGFRHALTADAAYASIPPHRRARLHREAAALLAQGDGATDASVALHLREAGDPAWTRYAEAAADGPLAFLDPVGAYELLRDVVTSDPTTRRRFQIAARMCHVALRTPHVEEAARLADESLSSDGGPDDDRADLRLALSLLLFALGDMPTAYANLRRCALEAPERSSTRVHAMSILAVACEESMTLQEHLHWLHQADQGLVHLTDEAHRHAVQVNLLAARCVMGSVTIPDAIALIPDGSANPAVLREEQRARWNVAEFALYLGNYDEAGSLLTLMVEQAGSLVPEYRAALKALEGHYDFLTGRWQRLLETADKHRLEDPEAVDAHSGLLLAYTLAAHESAVSGRPKANGELLQLAARAREVGLMPVALGIYSQHALEMLDEEHPDAARQTVMRALEVLRHKGVWAWSGDLLPIAAYTFSTTDGAAAVGELVTEASAGLAGIEAPAPLLGLSIARAIAQERAEERVLGLQLSADVAAKLPRPLLAARTSEWAADACPDAEQSVSFLAGAARIYEELGATRHHMRVASRLREIGIPVTSRRRAVFGDPLTAREREIVELAAGGSTNREIAARLFLSTRTVEHHIERARRKLGAANRAALREVHPRGQRLPSRR
jgi:DNA-binding CsgD family transcriptional regulator/tetratricopeptide (TPR) repeat protein